MTGASTQSLLADTRWLRRLSRALVHDIDLADDLYHDVVLAALCDPSGASRPWLVRVAHNLSISMLRREVRRRQSEGGPMRDSEVSTTVEIVAEAELQQEAVDALMQLDEPYRTTLLLRFMKGLSIREVALQMQVPAETVRTRQRRGLALLREELEESRRGRLAMVLPMLRSRDWLGPTAVLWGVLTMKTKLSVACLAVVFLGLLAAFTFVSTDETPVTDQATDLAVASVDLSRTRVAEPVPERQSVVIDESIATAEIYGSVLVRALRQDTAKPVAGVGIGLRTGYTHVLRTLATNADGTVVFDRLRPGMGSVSFRVDRKASGNSPDDVTIRAGEQSEVVIFVDSGWDLHGVVVDREGQPVAGASIYNVRLGYHPLWVHELTTTNDEGRFWLTCLDGHSSIGASAPGLGRSKRMMIQALKRTDRQIEEVSIELPGESVSVTGIVTDPQGRPLAEAYIRVGADDMNGATRGKGPRSNIVYFPVPASYCTSDALGRFSVDELAPGAIPVFVYVEGYAPWTGSIDAVVGAVNAVACQLSDGATLSGTVVNSQGSPLSGAKISLVDQLAPPRTWATTDAQGQFELADLVGGILKLEVKSKGSGDRVETVSIVAGRANHYDIKLTTGSQLRGRIVDKFGKGLPDYLVVDIAPPRASARTDSDGHFTISNCDDRSYTVQVFSKDGFVPFVAVMKALQPDGTEHLLRIGEEHRLASAIRGRAVDPKGSALASVSVTLIQSPGEHFILGLPSGNELGNFVVGKLAAGDYQLSLSTPGLAFHTTVDIHLDAAQDLDLGDVELKARVR